MTEKKKVLFVCIGNSARSQIAQGLLEDIGGNDFEVYSAGSHPKNCIDNLAVKAMEEVGIDISEKSPKNCKEYSNENFDYVISLCEEDARDCPVVLTHAAISQWSIADPVSYAGGGKKGKKAFFKQTVENIKDRIEDFVALRDLPMWEERPIKDREKTLQNLHTNRLSKELEKLYAQGIAIDCGNIPIGHLIKGLSLGDIWKLIGTIAVTISVIASSAYKLGAGSWPWQSLTN